MLTNHKNKALSQLKYAGIIVHTDKGIALQQRDIKHNIFNPGRITLFGGCVEKGEMPKRAAIRELYEELNLITLNTGTLRFLGKLYSPAKEKIVTCYIFYTEHVKSGSLTIHEGKSIYYVSTPFSLDKISRNKAITPITLKALGLFLNQNHS